MVSRDGATIRVLDNDVYGSPITHANFIIVGNFEQLYAIQLDDLKELMNHSVDHQAFALVPDNDALVVVDKQLLVTLFRINFNQ